MLWNEHKKFVSAMTEEELDSHLLFLKAQEKSLRVRQQATVSLRAEREEKRRSEMSEEQLKEWERIQRDKRKIGAERSEAKEEKRLSKIERARETAIASLMAAGMSREKAERALL